MSGDPVYVTPRFITLKRARMSVVRLVVGFSAALTIATGLQAGVLLTDPTLNANDVTSALRAQGFGDVSAVAARDLPLPVRAAAADARFDSVFCVEATRVDTPSVRICVLRPTTGEFVTLPRTLYAGTHVGWVQCGGAYAYVATDSEAHTADPRAKAALDAACDRVLSPGCSFRGLREEERQMIPARFRQFDI